MFHNGITMHGAKHVKYSKTLTMFTSMQETLGSNPSQVTSVISHRELIISPSSVAISGQTSCLPRFLCSYILIPKFISNTELLMHDKMSLSKDTLYTF